MAVLALREFERITAGDTFDPGKRQLSKAQFQALERFAQDYEQRHKVSVFRYGARASLVAQNLVGVISLGAHQVEILPKIEGESAVVRHNLAGMLAVVLDTDFLDGDAADTSRPQASILEVLIKMFCQRLWQQVRRGILRRYETREDNLSVLRGRLSVSGQLRHNLARMDRLYCIHDEFTEDNLFNQVLKATLCLLSNVSRSQANQREIAELLFCFMDVQEVSARSIRWERVKTDRLNAGYRPLLQLSRMFLEGQPPDVVSGKSGGFSLLFDMNVLFERYIGEITRRQLSDKQYQVRLQSPIRHLANNEDGNQAFALRPDIVVAQEPSKQPVLVLDTKWKKLDGELRRDGVAVADAYQMYAYARRYQVPAVVLLYPHHGALGAWQPFRQRYWLEQCAPGQEIRVCTIDLQDLRSVPAQIEKIAALGGLGEAM